MTIDLSQLQFENDFSSVDLPDGNTLSFYKVDESLVAGEESQDIKAICVEITLYETDEETGETVVAGTSIAPCIIGLGDERILISTLYTEYQGQGLSEDNIAYCTLEYYDASE